MNKKVLIITYYWPPSGGAGVQRWLKMSGYLPEYGWDPVILTPENPSFINTDQSLLADVPESIEVLKLPIWEPYSLFGFFKGKKVVHQKDVNLSAKKKTLFEKLSLWVRGNLIFPDPRTFWVKPVAKFLENYLPDSGISHIITTGPPHSLHLIGARIKKRFNIKWIADFRDPWSEFDIHDSFYMSGFARKMHKKLEYKVLRNADLVLAVGWLFENDLQRLGASKTGVILNGFDHNDFKKHVGDTQTVDNEQFTIRHIGSVDELRNPRPFFEALEKLVQEGKVKKENLKIEFIGNVNPVLKKDVGQNPLWDELIQFKDYVPHSEILKVYASTDLLLLVLAHSHTARLNIPGKIFEYVATGIPVLGIGDPEGDGAKVLVEEGAGKVFAHHSVEDIADALLKHIQNPAKRKVDIETSPYTRQNMTRKLAKLMNEL